MTQRLIAALVAIPLTVALLVLAAVQQLPYVVFQPGPTFDILASPSGGDVIKVRGEKSYPDTDGQLRFTTVSVSPNDGGVRLPELLSFWLSRSSAVYPYEAQYPPGQTEQQSRDEGAVQMVDSQDTAVAVALDALGYDIKPALEVQLVQQNTPAEGKLMVRDIFESVDGKAITGSGVLTKAIAETGPGESVNLEVQRDGKSLDIELVPETVQTDQGGRKQIGVSLGQGYTFPFRVSVGVNPNIGGPSAGLMFSLGIYDTLTPGSLVDGNIVAGTGEINPGGSVGPIGGIQQKIAGARRDGVQLFLVPADNCADALGADNGEVRLARVDTFKSALSSVKAWVGDHGARLPSCADTQETTTAVGS